MKATWPDPQFHASPIRRLMNCVAFELPLVAESQDQHLKTRNLASPAYSLFNWMEKLACATELLHNPRE
ncbi:unnamed protein product [Merluccius merluccius]